MMFYFTEGFDNRGVWKRNQAEEELDHLPIGCTLKDPYLLYRMWQQWVRRKFYKGVVFRFFDLGDLAFCPNRRAEQFWKDKFGKKGLLQFFRPQYVERSWEGFWKSVGVHSLQYLERAEGVLQQAVNTLPEENSYPFRDTLEYQWIPDFLEDFRNQVTQGLWEAGVVQRDSPCKLTSGHEAAAWRMMKKEFHGSA